MDLSAKYLKFSQNSKTSKFSPLQAN